MIEIGIILIVWIIFLIIWIKYLREELDHQYEQLLYMSTLTLPSEEACRDYAKKHLNDFLYIGARRRYKNKHMKKEEN